MRYCLATGSILSMMIYFIVDNHVSFFPWNNLAEAGDQLPSTLMGVVPFSFVLLALFYRSRTGTLIGVLWAFVWLVLQIRQWWLPYLWGPSILHADFSWYFSHGYTSTLRILPVFEGRPVPDLQHMVLQTLSMLNLIALILVARTFKKREPSGSI